MKQDSSLIIVCTTCGTRNRVAQSDLGKKHRCGSCKTILSLPQNTHHRLVEPVHERAAQAIHDESWHAEFSPQKFLGRVRLDQLIERNEAYNANSTNSAEAPCVFCGKTRARGIFLNNKKFLCEQCYAEVAMIGYPERYETLRRQFVLAREARRIAWESFKERFEHKSDESIFVFFGWATVPVPLLFVNSLYLIMPAVLLAIGYTINGINKRKTQIWLAQKAHWEQSNPEPPEPVLKHFHDPSACLTKKDRVILGIFNHWPGYPPFWQYLRAVVLSRDSNRCQVSGCPSRLELHVHHVEPVSEGGTHTPDNLVSLCDFHHALEPQRGHERIWGKIKTRYFTLVGSHERGNRTRSGTHVVRAHLRRLQLTTLDELSDLADYYGLACPTCSETNISLQVSADKNVVIASCLECGKSTEGPQQLTEETGPRLAEIFNVTKNKGTWTARWDSLDKRERAIWGTWSGQGINKKRKLHKQRLALESSAPLCPKCGEPMRLIRPRPSDTWETFWGCTQFRITGCNGSVNYEVKRKRTKQRGV